MSEVLWPAGSRECPQGPEGSPPGGAASEQGDGACGRENAPPVAADSAPMDEGGLSSKWAGPPESNDRAEFEQDEFAADGRGEEPVSVPRLGGGRRTGRRLVRKKDQVPVAVDSLTPQQRLLLLDTWQRSGLPAGDFAALVGISKHTLYAWKKRFDEEGPGGLMDRPRGGPKGSKLPELTKRTILMLKQANPDWGCQRISDMLLRGPALPASPSAVARVLHEAGYELEEAPTRPHPDQVRRFERAKPNQLWQTDLFTFVLKRQNRRVYLVAFMDDHSRFISATGCTPASRRRWCWKCCAPGSHPTARRRRS